MIYSVLNRLLSVVPYVLALWCFILAMIYSVPLDRNHYQTMGVLWMIVGSLNSIHYKL